MTIDEALSYGRFQLSRSTTPQLDARLLLQHVLQKPYSYLLAYSDAELTAVQAHTYQQLIQRARQHEPIPYLTGITPFLDFDLAVTPAVLIPRPETELLVEQAIAWAKARPALALADVGTGSGCIPIAMARALPHAFVYASDISAEALVVAHQNAEHLAPQRIQFYRGDLLDPIPASLDLILANLPYVTEGEWTMLDDGVKLHEPSLALIGGADGLTQIKRLLQQAPAKLKQDGAIFLEIGWQQGQAVQDIARAHFPQAQIAVIPDYAGHDRIVSIQLPTRN